MRPQMLLMLALATAVVADVSPLDEAADLGAARQIGGSQIQGLSGNEKSVVMAVSAKDFNVQNKMPGSFACYNAQTKGAALLAGQRDVFKAAAGKADAEFAAANALFKKSQRDVDGATSRRAMLAARLVKQKAQYAVTHRVAMKLFTVAKMDLNGYQNERKKVSLDARQSKAVLGTYLSYKKRYISVSADAEDPAKSKQVKRYLKLSTQYLKQYHTVQDAIKKSYTRAQVHQSAYFKLSKQYQGKASEAKKIASAVQATSVAGENNKQRLAAGKVTLETNKKALPPLQKKKADADAAFSKAEASYKAAAAKAAASKDKYMQLSSKATKVKAMANNAQQAYERNKLRYEEFMATHKDKSTSIKGVKNAVALLSKKITAATNTASLYQQSYTINKCAAKEAAEEELGEDAKATQEMGEVSAVTQCKEDKRVSASNKEAAKTATEQKSAEVTRLVVLAKEVAAALSGAGVAKKIRDTNRAKADRLKSAGKALSAAAQTPC